ncbi:MAG: AAA family ATPase [Methanomicrobiales archaeon]|jgi:exonuclease SbcC|nr:AAA family ATPase [Methanomicrobiales archaeon]
MRILSITFSNLNSLYGTWEIDFTHPEYREQGIFAIVGSTGSGKTTLLDAICLALYGKTPRLEKVTGTENEIISVGAEECFSSVRFSTSEGEYLAYWEQKKSRRKVDGSLQDAKQSLYLVDGTKDGKLLSNKKTEIATLISTITGLSGIDQFTRSVLLAQGKFSEFLETTEDNRAKMLEKITGVEIYTDISIAAHESAKEWNEKIREKEQEKNISLLTEEEIGQQTAYRDNLQQQLNEENIRKKEIEKQQEVYETVKKLKVSFHELDVQREKVEREKEEFLPELEILRAAQKAKEIETQYSGVKEIRKQVTKRNEDILAYIKQKSSAILDRDKARSEVEGAEQRYHKTVKEKEELEEVLLKVHALDTRIFGMKVDIVELEKEKLEKKSDIQQNTEEQKRTSQKQEQIEDEIQKQEKWLLDYKCDESLSSSLSGIRSQVEQRKKLVNEQIQYTEKSKKHRELEQKAKNHELKIREEVQRLQRDLERSVQMRDACKVAYELAMNGRDLETLQIDLEAAQSHKKDIEECIDRVTAYKSCISEWAAYYAEYLIEDQKLSEIVARFEDGKKEGKASKQRYDELIRLHRFSAERSALTSGTPCPLCGSVEHPYASQFVADEELMQAKKELTDGEKKEENLRKEEQVQRTVRDQICAKYEMRRDEHQLLYETAASLYDRIQVQDACELVKPQSVPDAEHIRTVSTCVDALQKLHTASIAVLTLRKEEFSNCTKQASAEKNAQIELDAVQKRFQEEEVRLQKSTQEAMACTQGVQQCDEHLRRVYEELFKNEKDLIPEIQNYGYRTLPETQDELDRIVHELSKRSQIYQERDGIQNLKQAELISLLHHKEVTATKFWHMQDAFKRVDEKLRDLEERCLEFVSSRTELFGDKVPGAEQKAVDARLKSAESEMRTAHTRCTTLETEIQSLEKQIRDAETALLQEEKEKDAHEQDFALACVIRGFETEEAFMRAFLPLETINTLLEKEQRLSGWIHQLSGQQRHLEKEWNKINHKLLSEADEEKRSSAYQSCNEQIRSLIEEIGRVKERLEADEKARSKVQQLQSEYELLCREALPWLELDTLIGSSDGKIYRDFAQSLIFDVLIAYANIHLQRLTDRYQLAGGERLTFQVRDLYHAGEIRSVKNLSGGERFIVSLALALGLSGMAGERICIDSLFLDEGFGTLDEQALEIALDALSNLPHEGKTIGIISHVRALKERIPTQIFIQKLGGGRSMITGPGCRFHRS